MAVLPVPHQEPPVHPPALPEDGPRVFPPRALGPSVERSDDPAPELWRLAAQAESLLGDTTGLFDGAHIGQRVGAVAGLLRDAAAAVAAADAHVAEARAEAARVADRAEEEVARLWRTVSADVATRRAATDAFVARAVERAERDADARLADASARADLLLARAEDLVAAWLDEANAEVARILAPVPAPPPAATVAPTGSSPPRRPRRRRRLRRLFRRRSLEG
ncbi:MAG TPA: hypothetical protein VG455_03235 [Acidimicrobiales bacterium]|nr:hypothetical protein [Acidimicrobiales bacterium]